MAVSTTYLLRRFSLEAQGGSMLQASRWCRSGKNCYNIILSIESISSRTQRGFDRAQGILSPTC